jgi:high-affinity Fe2+/Pb2+ permease
MSVVSFMVGIVLIAICFGLMVWGQKYLGEERGRNPKGTDKQGKTDTIENPCRNCGSCVTTQEK